MRNRANEYLPIRLAGNEPPEQLRRLGIYRSGPLRLVLFADGQYLLQRFTDIGGWWLTQDHGPLHWKENGLLLFSRRQIPYGQVFFGGGTDLLAVMDDEFFHAPHTFTKVEYPKVLMCQNTQVGPKDFSNSITAGKAYMVMGVKPGPPYHLHVINDGGHMRYYPSEIFGEI